MLVGKPNQKETTIWVFTKCEGLHSGTWKKNLVGGLNEVQLPNWEAGNWEHVLYNINCYKVKGIAKHLRCTLIHKEVRKTFHRFC